MPILRDAFFVVLPASVSAGARYELIEAGGTPLQSGAQHAYSGYTIIDSPFTGSATLTHATVFQTAGSLYATDPANGEAYQVATIAAPATPAGMASLGNSAVFAGLDGESNTRLWTTDGTSAGTAALLPAGAAADFRPRDFARFGNLVLFQGRAADGTPALWRTDGTVAGTVEIVALRSDLGELTPIGVADGRLVFFERFNGYGHGSNFLSTDGTATGTSAIGPDYNFGFPSGPGVQLPNGSLLAAAYNLVSLDGVGAPTVIAGPPGAVANVTALGQGAAFTVTDLTTTRLWVTDGTTAGTREVDTAQVDVGNLTAFGSRVLFSAQDQTGATTGLWVTDGTDAGTVEIAAGINPSSIVVDDGRAFVVGAGGSIYTTDGTVAGTQQISPAAGYTISPGVVDTTHVWVSGSGDQYEVVVSPTGDMVIADTVPNRDGSATYDARTISFIDTFGTGTGLLDPTGNAEAVNRVLLTAYDKPVDVGVLIGLTEQLDAGALTLVQVADMVLSAPRFVGLSDAAFVTQLYSNEYHRPPDAGGLAAFTNALASGVSRGTVLVDVSQSFESRADTVVVGGQANDATVYRLYQAVLDRAPDPNGQQFFSAALTNGLTVPQLAADLLGSGEYASRFGTPSNDQFVADLYQNILHRAADPSGLASFGAELASGASRPAWLRYSPAAPRPGWTPLWRPTTGGSRYSRRASGFEAR